MKRCLNCMKEYPEDQKKGCPFCGFSKERSKPGSAYFPLGEVLQGRYIVGTVLRERAEDVFYIGWDALFKRTVQIQEYFPRDCAVRAMDGRLCADDTQAERYQAGLEQFYSRSRELIRLYREEDIITYHACMKENGTAYAVMDYPEETQSLREWFSSRTLSEQEAMALLQAGVDAAAKVHKSGGFHGMLGIDAFRMTKDGKVILTDFGGWMPEMPMPEAEELAAAGEGILPGQKCQAPQAGAEKQMSGAEGILPGQKCQAPQSEAEKRLSGAGGRMDGVRRDVSGLAAMFVWLLTGIEVSDEKSMQRALAGNRTTLKKPLVSALKRALSGETPDLRQFQEELSLGAAGRTKPGNGKSSFGKKNGGKNSSGTGHRISPWAVIGIAAAVIILAVVIFLVVNAL